MLAVKPRSVFKLTTHVAAVCSIVTFTIIVYYLTVLAKLRVPIEYIPQNAGPLVVDISAPTTRGSMEARKSHKGHEVLPEFIPSFIPSKYTSSPSGLPIANYAVMIDAGSSGSRVYVYQYKLPFGNAIGQVQDVSADMLHISVAEDINHTPIVRKQEPGLSAFGTVPEQAFSSIEPLLEFAAQNIPKGMLKHTPVYIFATAGLRMLPMEQSKAVLENVRSGLRKMSDNGKFLFESNDQADIISGEEEGLFGWLALNYIKDRFGDLTQTYPTGGIDPHSNLALPRVSQSMDDYLHKRGDKTARIIDKHPYSHDKKSNTVGLLEIGGGSAQIAFEASAVRYSAGSGSSGIPVEHPDDYIYKVDLDLISCDNKGKTVEIVEPKKNKFSISNKYQKGGHQYDVYTASFLGHGVNAARSRFVNMLVDNHLKKKTNSGHDKVIYDDCLLRDQFQIVSLNNVWGRGANNKEVLESGNLSDREKLRNKEILKITSNLPQNEYLFIGTGDWDACRTSMHPLLEKDLKCRYESCPIGGQYQPKLTHEMLKSGLYGFSEYWFSTQDVLKINPSEFSSEILIQASKNLCHHDNNDMYTISEKLEKKEFPSTATERRLREQCFKAAWLDTLLFEGHGVPRAVANGIITPISSIEGAEVQWTLGATLLKITEKIKKNTQYCKTLELNTHINTALENAKNEYEKDYAEYIEQTDYFGHSGGWKFTQIMIFCCFCVCIISLIIAVCYKYNVDKLSASPSYTQYYRSFQV